ANIARIKSSMTEPDWISARLQNDLAYAGHPYALNGGGTLTTLAAITRADLQNFVKNNLSRDRLHIGVAGDITPAELAVMLDKIFGGLPAAAKTTPLADITIQNTGKTYLYQQDIPQSFINLLSPGLDYKDPDFYAGNVMNFILGGSGFGSRLTEEVREKRGLTYGIYSSLYDMDHANGFSIGLSTENKNAGAALKIIRDELAKMRDQGVTAQELSSAKSYLIGSLPLSFSSTSAIAGALLSLQMHDYPMDHYDRYPAIISGITRDDIERVSRRLLNPDQMLGVVVGQPQGITPTQVLTRLPNVE
ncbi:MAG TPA: pitrilysin family protein, partial [Micavibrio sp.]